MIPEAEALQFNSSSLVGIEKRRRMRRTGFELSVRSGKSVKWVGPAYGHSRNYLPRKSDQLSCLSNTS